MSETYANFATIEASGETDTNKIYIDAETNTSYRYNGSEFVSIGGGSKSEPCNGVIISNMNIKFSEKEIDYINSRDSISFMWFTRPTLTSTDWYRYLTILDADRSGLLIGKRILRLGYDGGFLIFDNTSTSTNPDFKYKVRGYRNIVSINKKDGIDIGYDDMGEIFNQQLERFKQDVFIEKENSEMYFISPGDRKNSFYEWIMFNFDVTRLFSFNSELLNILRNRVEAAALPSNFYHTDYNTYVIDKPKPSYGILTLEQDSEGYWHNKTDLTDKSFGLNSKLGNEVKNKALRNTFIFEVTSGSCRIDNLGVSIMSNQGKWISTKNLLTGEDKEYKDELGVGKWEVIADFYDYSNYPIMARTINTPFDLKLIEDKCEPYSVISHVKFNKFYDGLSFDDEVTGKRIFSKRVSSSYMAKGNNRFDETTYENITPNRTPRFIGEKWVNISTGDIYEAGNLTTFKKLNDA